MIAQNLEWIKEGIYVDAKDKYQDWQVGWVMAITKSHIKIRFDGWAAKIDEVYPLVTQRIKPFRSITKGYTGQKKSPSIRQHWTFTIENHESRLSQFEQFVGHISQKSGFEMTQYLRGENYFYIDFLMSLNYYNVQQIKKVYDYFKANFEFVKSYFQQFIQRDTNAWFQAGQKQQLTTKKVYADLHYEIFESITSIIGSIPRCAVFVKSNQKLLKEMYGNDTSYQTFMARQLNNIQFLVNFDSVVIKIFEQVKNGLRTTPLTFINSLYSLFAGLEKISLNAQFKKKLNNNFVGIIQEYIGSMTVQDAKSNEKTIEQILSQMRIMCNKLHSEKEEICRWIEKARLKLWIYLIQCDVLEKKLRGIGKLKDFYEFINKKLINPLQNSLILCTRTQFRQWMDQQQLLKVIFQTNEHSEVIKKGCEMVQHFYVCKYKVCYIEDVVFIWETCFKKHEAIKRIIFQFWKDFGPFVSGQEDWKLFIGVLTNNEQNINEEWEIESLFGFLRAIKSDDQNDSNTEIIKMMYRKTLKDPKYIPQLAKQLSYFENESKVLQSMVDNCLTQISSKSEPIFHLKLLAKIYNELHNYKTYIPENIIIVLIEELREFVAREENEKFVHTIFNLFNEIMTAKDNGASSKNPNGVRFTFENFETLWEIFSNCHIPQFRRLFFSWMVSRSFNSMYNYTICTINMRFNHEFRLEIFSNILCDESKFNYRKLDSYEFSVFKEFFIYANLRAGSLESKPYSLGPSSQPYNRKIIRTKSKDIQGLKELWQIFKNCQNDDVVVSCSTFLKDLYLRVSSIMPVDEKTQRIKSLMQIIQTSISEGQKSNSFSLIKKILILISKLLTDIKQKIQIPKQFQKAQRSEKQTIKAYLSSMSDVQSFQIYVQESFVNIKSIIAKKFHMSRDEFTLMSGKIQIPKQLYDLPYYLYNFDQAVFRIVKVGNEMGKYVMTNVCQHIYHKIINFLKNQQVCTEAFHLLQYLDIFEPVRLFENLSKDIQEVDEILKNKKKLYLHIFFTRVFINIVQKQISQVDSHVLEKMISHLEIPIESNLIVSYLQKLVEILTDLNKKNTSNHQQQSLISLNCYIPKLYKLMLNLVKYMNHNLHTVTNHEIKLFSSSLMLYMNGFQNAKLLFDSFIKDQNFREFMFEVFIQCEVLQIKRIVEKRICSWLKEGFCSTNEQRKVAQFFINELYYAIYQKDSKKEINGAEFIGIFKLFRTIIESISNQIFREIIYENHSPIQNENLTFSKHISKSIFRLSDSPTSPNFMLNGQLQILVGMIKRDRSLISMDLIDYLFYNCLIYVHGKTNGMEVKCLFKENITLVLEILWYSMVNIENQGHNENVRIDALSLDKYADTILTRFRDFHYNDQWRNSREWTNDFLELSKTKNDFVGLENPGCICYLNSLLQQLYMIEEFRSAVLNMNTMKNAQEGQIEIPTIQQDSPQLIIKLKYLFLNLMYSQRSAIDPQFFTTSIRTTGNRPMVRIFEQMDIDEFSMILFDKIENKLHKHKVPNFIRQLFGGTYSNQIISQECSHSSERQEPFLSISLDVKKHITESFHSLVKGELLEGQNAYFCDGCDKKVKALKRFSIKRLPPHLIISLRRFEFDYETDQKIKINKYCEFPFELNLQNFSQDKLNESNPNIGKKLQQCSSTSMNEEQPVEKPQQKKNNFPPEYFVYKLKGVVIHTGSADSGHYYSFIERKDGGWFEFNDERVMEFDVKNLGEEAFGGKDGEYTRIRNAYLLFYQRKAKTHFNNHTYSTTNTSTQKIPTRMLQESQCDVRPSNYFQQSLNESSLKALQQLMSNQRSTQLQQNKRIIQEIVMQNKKIRLSHFFFSKEYLEFVLSFVKQALYPTYAIKINEYMKLGSDYHYIMPVETGVEVVAVQNCLEEDAGNLEQEVFKFLVSYTFLIQFRHKNYCVTFQLLQAINKLFFEHSDVQKRFNFIETFLEEICHQSFIDEFLVNCIAKEKSKMVSNFIFQAIKSYLTLCPMDETNSLPKVIKTIIKLVMRTGVKTNTNIAQLLIIIRKLLSLKQSHPMIISPIINFMLKKDFVTVLIDNALGVGMSKEVKAKKVQLIDNDDEIPMQSQSKPQTKRGHERKSSDLSAKDEDEGAPIKKKHINQKMEVQGEERSLDTLRFSVLFGQYPQDAGVATKTNDKQVWTILYEIQQEIKAKKHKIDTIKESISFIKKVPIQQEKITMNLSPKNIQNPSKKQPTPTVNKSTALIKSPVSRSRAQINGEVEGTEEYESSSMEQESEEEESWEDPEQELALNENDMRDVNENLAMVNKCYPEIAPLPKANPEANIPVVDNSQPTQKIDVDSQVNLVNNESAAKISIDLTFENKSPEINQIPNNQNQNPQQQIQNQPKEQIQLSQQQLQQLSQLEQMLVQYEREYSEMDCKFYAPLAKLKIEKIMKILSQQKDTKSIIALGAFISELVFNTISFNQTVLSAIETAFKDYESSKYRPLFLLLEKLLEVNDDLANKRRSQVLTILRTALRTNEKYFIECDFIHQFILRYVTRIPTFESLIKETPIFINEMKSWISQKKTPGLQTIKKHRQPNCERHSFRNHGILVSCDLKDYENLSNYKFESFEKIKLNRFTSTILYPEEPKVGQMYKKGDFVEVCFENGSWTTGLIEENYFGILQVNFASSNIKPERNLYSEDDEKVKLKMSIKIEQKAQKMEIEK